MEPLRLCDHEMGIKVIRDQPSFLRREGKTNFCVRTEKKKNAWPDARWDQCEARPLNFFLSTPWEQEVARFPLPPGLNPNFVMFCQSRISCRYGHMAKCFIEWTVRPFIFFFGNFCMTLLWRRLLQSILSQMPFQHSASIGVNNSDYFCLYNRWPSGHYGVAIVSEQMEPLFRPFVSTWCGNPYCCRAPVDVFNCKERFEKRYRNYETASC